MDLFFAPLQGYTDHVFRRIHHDLVGGVDAYFSPFLRWDGGKLRNKDLRDILPENNRGVPLVPQVIASGVDELAPLLDVVQQNGYDRVDINMGCPFPMQTGRGRGAALLAHPDRMETLLRESARRPELTVSVKMRIGFSEPEEGLRAVEMLNGFDISFLTIHPRLGTQHYKGQADMDAFAACMAVSRHPVVYNGDLVSTAQIDVLSRRFPDLKGVMLGRGLLARPTLAVEWRTGNPLSDDECLRRSLAMHDCLCEYAHNTLQGDHQVLARLQTFWEYQPPLMDKRVYKRLMKSKSLAGYEAVLRELR